MYPSTTKKRRKNKSDRNYPGDHILDCESDGIYPDAKNEITVGSEGNSDKVEYNQEDCPRDAGKSTDDNRYPVITDVGFSGILHEMKEVHHNQCDKTDNGVYYQLPDVLNDIECNSQENDNDQDKDRYTKKCHRWLNILVYYIKLTVTWEKGHQS